MPLPTIQELIDHNENGETVLIGLRQRLNDLRPGEDPDEDAVLIAEISSVTTELNLVRSILIHLRAAETVIQPMSDETLQELDALAAAIDQAILDQAWLSASIDIAQELLDTVSKLREITQENT